MDPSWLVAAVSIAGLVALDIVATVAVVRNDGLSKGQKAMQVVLAWAVPVLGAIVCLMFAREPDRSNADPEDEVEAVLDLMDRRPRDLGD